MADTRNLVFVLGFEIKKINITFHCQNGIKFCLFMLEPLFFLKKNVTNIMRSEKWGVIHASDKQRGIDCLLCVSYDADEHI